MYRNSEPYAKNVCKSRFFLSAKFILDPSELVSEMINFQTLRAIWNKFENKFMYVTIIHHIRYVYLKLTREKNFLFDQKSEQKK